MRGFIFGLVTIVSAVSITSANAESIVFRQPLQRDRMTSRPRRLRIPVPTVHESKQALEAKVHQAAAGRPVAANDRAERIHKLLDEYVARYQTIVVDLSAWRGDLETLKRRHPGAPDDFLLGMSRLERRFRTMRPEINLLLTQPLLSPADLGKVIRDFERMNTTEMLMEMGRAMDAVQRLSEKDDDHLDAQEIRALALHALTWKYGLEARRSAAWTDQAKKESVHGFHGSAFGRTLSQFFDSRTDEDLDRNSRELVEMATRPFDSL